MPKHKASNTFLLNNLGSKYSQLIKLVQLMSYWNKKNFI